MKRINLLFADLSSSSTDFNNRLFLSRFNTCFFELVNLLWFFARQRLLPALHLCFSVNRFGEDRLDGSYSEASTLSGIKGLLFDFIKYAFHKQPAHKFTGVYVAP
jgi:hypothetical protein